MKSLLTVLGSTLAGAAVGAIGVWSWHVARSPAPVPDQFGVVRRGGFNGPGFLALYLGLPCGAIAGAAFGTGVVVGRRIERRP